MLKQYRVTYWNKQNQKVGMTVSAQSALDARRYVETFPEFKCLITYPEEI